MPSPKIQPYPWGDSRRLVRRLIAVSFSALLCTVAVVRAQNPQPVPSGTIVNASLTVGAATTHSVGPDFCGFSFEDSQIPKKLFTSSNTNLIGLFKTLGPSILRIGGNSVHQEVWTPNGTGGTTGQIAPADIQNLSAFLQAAGWKVIYSVNDSEGTSLAAQEVTAVTSTLGSQLTTVTIGNEPNDYYTSYSTFQSTWNSYDSAIVGATPSVNIQGPETTSNLVGQSWLSSFMSPSNNPYLSTVKLESTHYYIDSATNGTLTEMLTYPDTNLANYLTLMKSDASGTGIPFRLTEANSFSGGGTAGVSNSFGSALWAIDFLFENALYDCAGANFHSGNSAAYSPIQTSGSSVTSVQPEYYGMLLFSLAGTGPVLDTTSWSSGGVNSTAHAVQVSSGADSIILINKDTINNLSVTITLPSNVSSATLLQMACSGGLSGTSGVTIQGSGVALNGAFSPNAAYTLPVSGNVVTAYVPAASAVLISVTPDQVAAPTGLTATASSSTQVNLAWNAVANATSYNVKAATVSGGPYTTIATGVTTTSYSDTAAAAGTTTYYVVSAVDSLGTESANSNEASATTSIALNPTADAFVRDGTYANTNYGTATLLTIKCDVLGSGYNRKSYLTFDTSSASSVTSATLKVYVASVNTSASRTISVYAVPTTSWGETSITWNNAPAAGTSLGSFAVSNTAGVWYSVDVSSYVQAQRTNGVTKVSFLLINNGPADSKGDVSFASREAATGKPDLVIQP